MVIIEEVDNTASNTRSRKNFKFNQQQQKDFADKVFGGKRKQKMDENTEKKTLVEPPGFLAICYETFIAIDSTISRKLAICAKPDNSLRLFMMLLEYSGHGVPWFGIIFYLLFFQLESSNLKAYTIVLNVLWGLILDVIFVGVIKSIVRRPRPVYNHAADMKGFVKADQYSFPSGHACRVVLMAVLLDFFIPFGTSPRFMLWAWAFWVSFSRIMLGRHYASDVCTGALLAFFIGYLMKTRWLLSKSTCNVIVNLIKRY